MSLSNLATKHRCNKNNHIHNGVYLVDIYEQYFDKIKNNNISFLEIGVYEGASIGMWLEYFNNIDLYMIDIDPNTKKYERPKVDITIGSQADENIIKSITDKCNSFDIILDDGSHINELTLKSFDLLWKYLKPGGLYIIEDTHCTYEPNISNWSDNLVRNTLPGMKYNSQDIKLENKRSDIITFLSEKTYELDYNKTDIYSINIYSKSIILQKNK